MTGPAHEAFRKVALVEPLARQLKLKKAKMEDALQAYAQGPRLRRPRSSPLRRSRLRRFTRISASAMLQSERPKGLKKAELEQYDVMLEEQAFPFEEKAIELHEANARRAAAGL